jgi:uncharacterized protein
MEDFHAEIARLTEEHGGQWGINHTHRLLHLVEDIGAGLTYDQEVVWTAAHLHDWGAYPPWAQSGVDHVVRSVQVARAFLPEKGFPPDFAAAVLDCIEFHHQAGSERRLESILLRDADALDFLGVVGVLRDFAKQPKDMRKAYETVHQRMDKLPGVIVLEKAKAIAARRLQEMQSLLQSFEKDSFGCF